MKETRRAAAVIACLHVLAPRAAAEIVFDFEELPSTSIGSLGTGALASLVSERDGVTLTVTRSAGGLFDLGLVGGANYPAAFGNRVLDPFVLEDIDDYFVGVFSTPVTSVTLDATDFAEDQDELALFAYAGPVATGDFIDSALEFWPMTSSSPEFLSITVTAGEVPIESIRFRGGSPTAFPNSMFIDNITVTPVPEPGEAELGVAIGLVVSAGAARRRAVESARA